MALILVCLAAGTTMMAASGFNDWAYSAGGPNPGIDDEVAAADETANSGSTVAEDLSSTFLSFVSAITIGLLSKVTGGVLGPAYSAESAASNIGVPAWGAAYLAAPVAALIGFAVIYFLTGRRL